MGGCLEAMYGVQELYKVARGQGRTGPPRFGKIPGGPFQVGPFTAKLDQKVLKISNVNWKSKSEEGGRYFSYVKFISMCKKTITLSKF